MLLRPSLLAAKKHGGGGGGGGYLAPAVHFDGTVSFGTASLVAPADSGLVGISIWIKTVNPGEGLSSEIFICDGRQPGGAYTNAFILQHAVSPPTDFDVYLSDSASNNFLGSGGYTYVESAWTHFLVTANTNLTAGNKIFRVYRNDVDVTEADASGSPAFVMKWNGVPIDIGSAGDTTGFYIGAMAELFIMPGTGFHDGSGDIPVSTRRLFISASGKPVNPATAVAALGTPAVLLSGDATTFFNNQGSGGDLTASPGSTGALTNASTSPSD